MQIAKATCLATGLLVVFSGVALAAPTTMTLYVAPSGSDSAPGTLAQPFKTIEHARDAVRAVNTNMTEDIHVVLRGGIYSLVKPIEFGPADSGFNGHRVIYEAYPGEKPVLSGGVAVTGWSLDHQGVYKITLARDIKLRTLYVNDFRASLTGKVVKALGPSGTFTVAGTEPWAESPGTPPDGILFSPDKVPVYHNPEDVEIEQQHTWNATIIGVRNMVQDAAGTIVQLQRPAGAITSTMRWGTGLHPVGVFTIRNAFELLQKPGEFYFDRPAHTLYYASRGENMASAAVIAPTSQGLIKIAGESMTKRVQGLTFMTPDLDASAKVFYAGATYICCSILYTGINTPVTAILSALTPDPRERVLLTSFRMFGSKAGVLLVNATLLPLMALLGHDSDRIGLIRVMPICALGSVILYLTAFFNLKETIRTTPKNEPIKASFSAIVGNWPWIIIFSSSLLFWIAFIARISTVPYYFQYVWNRKDLIPLVNSLDVVSLVSIFMIPWFCKWTYKANIWAWGLLGAVIAQAVICAGGIAHSLPIVLTGWIVGILASGVAMALPFSLLSESVDFGEWKSGVRAAGLLTAIGAAFCAKAGSGLGGAIPAWILGAYHYKANAVQTADAVAGINIDFIWIPAIAYTLALIPVLFYKKFELMEPQIEEDLKQRREASLMAKRIEPTARP